MGEYVVGINATHCVSVDATKRATVTDTIPMPGPVLDQAHVWYHTAFCTPCAQDIKRYKYLLIIKNSHVPKPTFPCT